MSRRLLPVVLLLVFAGLAALVWQLARKADAPAANGLETPATPAPAHEVAPAPEIAAAGSNARVAALETKPEAATAAVREPVRVGIQGRVCDRLRQGLAGADVRAMSWRALGSAAAAGDEAWTELEGLPPASATRSVGDGRFELVLALERESTRPRLELRVEIALAGHQTRTLVGRSVAGAQDSNANDPTLAASSATETSLAFGDVELCGLGIVGGSVHDRAGIACPGARIEIARRDPEATDEERRFHALCSAGEEGAFAAAGVREGRFELQAVLPDQRQGQAREFRLRAGEERYDVELFVPARNDTRTIAGTVLDPDGRPLAHAMVVPSPAGTQSGMISLTNDAGRFFATIGGPTNQLYDLRVRDQDGAYQPQKLAGVALGTQDLVVRLAPAMRIALDVYDSAGGVPTTIDWRLLDGSARAQLAKSAAQPTREGLFEVPVGEGEFRIALECAGEVPLELGPFDPEHAPARLEVAFGSANGLRGVVECNGAPVAGARIVLRRLPDEASRSLAENEARAGRPRPGEMLPAPPARRADPRPTSTDARGRFGFALPADGTWCVLADARGCGSGQSEPFAGGNEPPRELRVALAPYIEIDGRVVREDRTPASGCFVSASRGGLLPRSSRTDADGSFRFEDLPAGTWSLRAQTTDPRQTGWPNVRSVSTDAQPITLAPGMRTSVELALPRTHWVRVRVALQPAPPGGWEVSLGVPARPKPGELSYWLPGIGPDAEGRYLFECDEAGEARLKLGGEAEGWRVNLTRFLQVQPDGPQTEFDPPRAKLVLQSKQDPPQGSLFRLTWPDPSGYTNVSMLRAALGRCECPFAFTGAVYVERTPLAAPTRREIELRAGQQLVLDDL